MNLTSSMLGGNLTPDLSWGDFVRRLCAHPRGGISELLVLAGHRETDWLEFKAALEPGPLGFKYKPQSSVAIENGDNYRWNVAKAVIAMANTCGGIVLVGVDDTSVPVGLTSGGEHIQKDGIDRFCREVFDALSGGAAGTWKPLDAGGRCIAIECDKARIEGRCEILPLPLDGHDVVAIIVSPINPSEEDLIRIVERPDSGREREVVLVRKRGDFGGNEELTTFSRQREWKTALCTQPIKPNALWSQFCKLHPEEPVIDEAQLQLALTDYYHRLLKSRLWCEIDRCFTSLDGKEVVCEDCAGVNREDRVTSLLDPDAIEDLDDPVVEWGDHCTDDKAVSLETDSDEQSNDDSFTEDVDDKPIPEPRKGSISELIAEEQRCVLLGEPGGGKSTSLRAMTLADLRSPEQCHRVSLFVPLARYDGDLDDLIARETHFTAKLVRQLAEAGRLRLLLDALNECPSQYQESCIAQIRARLEEFPALYAVITTRTHNYRRQFSLPSFLVLPLADSRKTDFLRNYLRDPDRAADIISALCSNAAGEILTGSPLLLRLVAHVVNDGESLPVGRAQLYRLFVEGWFRRECGRLGKTGQSVPWDLAAVRGAMGALAWKTRTEGFTSCALTLARETLAEHGLPDADRFISTFSLGLLYHVDVQAGILEFLHETFQEYFAAEFAIAQQSFLEGFGITGERSRWQMTFAYALELAPNMSLSTMAILGRSNPLLYILASLSGVASDQAILSDLRAKVPIVMRLVEKAANLASQVGDVESIVRRVRDGDMHIDPELVWKLVRQFKPHCQAVNYLAACGHPIRRSWGILQAMIVGALANAGRWGLLCGLIQNQRLIVGQALCLSKPWDRLLYGARKQLANPLSTLPYDLVKSGLCNWGDFGLNNGLFTLSLLEVESQRNRVCIDLVTQCWRMAVVEVGSDVIILKHWAFPEGLSVRKSTLPAGVNPEVNDEIEVRVNVSDNNTSVSVSYVVAEVCRLFQSPARGLTMGQRLCGRVASLGRNGATLVFPTGACAFLPSYEIKWLATHCSDVCTDLSSSIEVEVVQVGLLRGGAKVSVKSIRAKKYRAQMGANDLVIHQRKLDFLSKCKVGQLLVGVVKNIVDFGVFVDLEDIDGLLHIDDMSWIRIKHPNEMVKVGDKLEVVILDINMTKERVSLGLKQLSPNPWDNIVAKYPVGIRLHGKVVNVVPYGAFVEIVPGVEGLVHVSEISWTKRISRATDVLVVGQEVDAVVLTLNQDEQKIALSMRQTEASPWSQIQTSYPSGTQVSGAISDLSASEAFVELKEGIEGVIHVSDMSWTHKVSHPSEILKKGDQVAAVVLDVDPDNQRISLGLKQAQEDPWSTIASRVKLGQSVKGKVSKIASFGVFIEIEEGVDGLVHISQMQEAPGRKVKDIFKLGQEVQARIILIDQESRKIALSMVGQ